MFDKVAHSHPKTTNKIVPHNEEFPKAAYWETSFLQNEQTKSGFPNPYLLFLIDYTFSITAYALLLSYYQVLTEKKDIEMTDFIRPEFSSENLPNYIGYHVQIFQAGRAKISLQTESMKKHEFFACLPKRDRQAYARQKTRSQRSIPDHFRAVDGVLGELPDARIFRLHQKGNNNHTADNAHLLVSMEQSAMWLIMAEIVHRWDLIPALAHVLVEGKGKRVGEASVFNEYMPTYEHDWEDTEFRLEDYRAKERFNAGEAKGKGAPPMLKPKESVRTAPQVEKRQSTIPDIQDDPDDDPALFTDPIGRIPDEDEFQPVGPAPRERGKNPILTNRSPHSRSSGVAKPYGKGDLWKAVVGGG